MNANQKKEIFILTFFVLLFILIRSINFSLHLNFSHDQAQFSAKALDILQNKTITLIGPPASFSSEGRQIFQGSVIYYFQLIFLLLGNFDPIYSSFIFMLFSSFMIVPLYLGVKWLTESKKALFVVSVFTLFPYYINYTRFLWNPNYQFSLLPLLIFLIGLYKKGEYKNAKILFTIGFFAGLLTLFHFQFLLAVLFILVYFYTIEKISIKKIPIFFLGLLVGVLPLIIFDLRHNFYNFKTLFLIVENRHLVVNEGFTSPKEITHYFLSITFLIFVLTLCKINIKLTKKMFLLLFLSLITLDLFFYIPAPKNGFRMSENWNYLDEMNVNKIIKSTNKQNFNVVNLVYDTKAEVQKYLLRKDGIEINVDNYYTNKFLFVITPNNKGFLDDPAYEIRDFKPAKIIDKWNIDHYHKLYLLRRI